MTTPHVQTAEKPTQTTSVRFAVLGAGSMGGALVRGMLTAGVLQPELVTICDHHPEHFDDLVSQGSTVVMQAQDLTPAIDVLLLAVKPQKIAASLAELAPDVLHNTLVISVAAGVTHESLTQLVPSATRVIRAMPSLGVQVQDGATALYAPDPIDPTDHKIALSLFQSVGYARFVTEDQLNIVGALAGSTPSYFALAIDALTLAGVAEGLDAKSSREFALHSMRSTAELLLQGDLHPRELMERVQSPAGTTVYGTLAAKDLIEEGFCQAARTAIARTRELAAR